MRVGNVRVVRAPSLERSRRLVSSFGGHSAYFLVSLVLPALVLLLLPLLGIYAPPDNLSLANGVLFLCPGSSPQYGASLGV